MCERSGGKGAREGGPFHLVPACRPRTDSDVEVKSQVRVQHFSFLSISSILTSNRRVVMARHAQLTSGRRVMALALAAITLSIALLTGLASAALFAKNSPVVQLTSSTFKRQVLDIEKPTLVAFTAPWCGHCQRLVPEYDRAARSLDGIVKFANIDCDDDANKATCGRYGIQGFPTIKLFPATTKRLPRDYRGERNAKSLVEYAVDSLPRSVTKVNAEDLKSFVVDKDPATPKVVLFSNKPTSSPLYKSLALDFRKSMVFAIARGDQTPVQSAARVHLGVNIKGDKDLPVLVAFGPRAGEDEAFDKTAFETYEGKLKIDLVKKWLDGLKEKWGVVDGAAAGKSSSSSSSSSQAKAKAKAKKGKKPNASSTDSSDEPLPEGGAYEWKPPPSKQQQAEPGPMLSKERASKLAEDIKVKQDALGKKKKGQPGDAKGMAFGEGGGGGGGREHKVQMNFGETEESSDSAPPPEPQGEAVPADGDAAAAAARASDDPFADPDAFPDHVNEGAYIYTDNQRADVHAMNQILEESGAYGAVDEALNRVGDAAKGAREAAGDAMTNVKKAAASIAEKLGSAGQASKDVEGQDADREPFIAKRRALLSTFERWLAGEHPDWEETYGEEFMRATRDVEQLLKTDPQRAEELAWENEEWMLQELKADREKMGEVLGEGKLENLEEMIGLIEKRLMDREGEEGRRRKEEGVEAAVEAVLRREKKAKAREAEKVGVDEAKGPEHDEL